MPVNAASSPSSVGCSSSPALVSTGEASCPATAAAPPPESALLGAGELSGSNVGRFPLLGGGISTPAGHSAAPPEPAHAPGRSDGRGVPAAASADREDIYVYENCGLNSMMESSGHLKDFIR